MRAIWLPGPGWRPPRPWSWSSRARQDGWTRATAAAGPRGQRHPPLRLRLVTAYPQRWRCDPSGPRSCAACATASGHGVARPRSPEPGRRRTPRRCADPARGGRACRATPTRPCRPDSGAWCGGWSWDASPRSWFGFQRQRYARTRPSGPHPQRVGDTGRAPPAGRHRQGATGGAALPAAVALQLPARWCCPGGHGMAFPRRSPVRLEPRSCACGATAAGPWRATAQPRPSAHALLLSGIGAPVLTRPCGPPGSQARLAVAWCAWSSGGHRVLLVAQGGSAAAGVAERPRPAPAVQRPTGEVGALRNNRPRGQALDRRRPPGRLS